MFKQTQLSLSKIKWQTDTPKNISHLDNNFSVKNK